MDTYELQLSDFLTNKLEMFIDSEREQFHASNASITKTAVHEIKRYSAFLSIIKRRALDASDRGNETLRCSAGRPAGPVRDELIASFEALAIHFQMEMESFYMFAKLYLDKTVHFLETYFGQRANCSFESFSRFDRILATLTSEHGFINQPKLVGTAKLL